MQFSKHTIRSLLNKLKAGELSCTQLIDETIDRCAKIKHLNYFTYQNTNSMREAAVAADKRYKEGINRPLEGIPICIKDNIDTKDSPTTAGSPTLKDNVSKFDSEVWFRLLNNGCINVGKTNMNEFALGTTTYNGYYGTAKNPFDETLIAGGSSGGTGGAVGSGAVPIGLGTDHSGSIRIPSSFNGLVGYKPSVGRWPSDFGIKASHIKDVVGPIAQDLDDIVLIDEQVTEARHKELPALKNITIAVPKMHFQESLDHRVEKALHEVIGRLRKVGVRVIENDGVDVTYDQGMTSFHIVNYEFKQRLEDYLNSHGLAEKLSFEKILANLGSDDVKQILNALKDHPSTSQEFFDAVHHHRRQLRETLFHYMEKMHADAILYPTCVILPPKIEDIHGPEWTIQVNGQHISQFLITSKNVDVASSANMPAITLPSVLNPTKDNLPIGMELATITGYDRRLISVARAVEKVIRGNYQ